MSDTQLLPEVDKELSDFDGHAHYARAKDLVSSDVVTALCGKRWVPQQRGGGALDLPICQPCKDLYDMLAMMDSTDG